MRPLFCLRVAVVLLAPAAAAASQAVFQGPPAVYETAPARAAEVAPADGPPDLLRWIWVQEQTGQARQDEAVRVPVFLSAGECADPAQLAVVRWPSGEAVPVQADDVRRAADGGVARLHLWFRSDLGANETQRWALVRRAPPPAGAAASVLVLSERLRIEAGPAEIEFQRQGGALAALRLHQGPQIEFPGGAAATLNFGAGVRTEPAGPVEWGVGPVFAKVATRTVFPEGAHVGRVWRIFAGGSVDLVQTIGATADGPPPAITGQNFLRGRADSDGEIAVLTQPAGLVDSLAGFHPGYVVDFLQEPDRPREWLVMPGTLSGRAGRVEKGPAGELIVGAPGDLPVNARNVRAFWAQVTFVPASSSQRRAALRAAAQPLVARVERPGMDLAAAVTRVRENVLEMKPVGWVNESAVRWLRGREDPFPRRRWAAESDPATWLEDARKALAKVAGSPPRALEEEEKGRAAGPLDPYHVTYGTTALAAWLARDALPEAPREALRAQLSALRTHLGRVDDSGWPYLDVFYRTQNMQMGPALLALADHDADAAVRRFYRDQLAAPVLGAVLPRGLRPYPGTVQARAEPSDTIYQAVVDFMLRTTELAGGESPGLPPLAFGRYLDAVDVTADLYHPAHPRSPDDDTHFARANFFRVQSHIHRWLAWGPAPFLALLQSPVAGGGAPGATEAWHFADQLEGRWKNWPDQSWLFLATEMPEFAARWSPPSRPPAAREVRVESGADGNRVSWRAEPGVAAWRVYRLRDGQPPWWVNSPWRAGGETPPLTATQCVDAAGRAGDRYRVHAVDAAGRESAW